MKRWSSMAKVFTRIGKDIVMAVKSGGPDPGTNSRLRAVIQNAKAANMPKVNVENAIKKASSKDQEDYKEMVLEGYGMHGVAVLVECTTDNNNRTVANVRSYFTKCNGSLGTNGMLDFIFERKCIFKIANTEDINLEELEFELIDFGADDVFLDEENNRLYRKYKAEGLEGQAIAEKIKNELDLENVLKNANSLARQIDRLARYAICLIDDILKQLIQTLFQFIDISR